MKVRKACSIPGKANPQLQFEFYSTTLLPKLEEAGRGERKVFFVDAAHFVMGAFLGMIWSFARVLVKTPPGRQRYNILGAIDSHSQELISIRTTENINSLRVVELLDKIRKKYPDTEVSLVMDNASYQRCYFVRDHARELGLELVFLPSYSPNLNLIERLWERVKRSRRHFADAANSGANTVQRRLQLLFINPLSPHLRSLQRRPQAPHAKSKFLATDQP